MAYSQTDATVGAYDAKTRFSELLQRVGRGEEITITRHGMPVARLVPAKRGSTPEERAAAVERLIQNRKGVTLGGLNIKDMIAEGRR